MRLRAPKPPSYLPPGGTATETSLSSANTTLITIQGLLTAGDTTAQAKLEAIRALLAAPVLPVGASTDSGLAAVQAGTDRIPVNAARDHVLASDPAVAQLSDGNTFYGPANPLPVAVAASSGLAVEAGGNLAAAKADLDLIAARTPALGQATMAASRPVVLPSDQVVQVDGEREAQALARLQSTLDDIRISQATSAGRMIPY